MSEAQQPREDWSLSDMPPEGHDDVGAFFYNAVQLGEADKANLELPDRWRFNHRMFRGDHWGVSGAKGRQRAKAQRLVLNMTFANIQRTVANLTAKQPVVEAVEVGNQRGEEDNADKDLTAWLKKWWQETEQGDSLVDAANQMEIYGPAIEKYVYSGGKPDTVVIDPFAFGIAPGIWEDLQNAPFVYHFSVMRTDAIEAKYGLEKGEVEADDVYSILGEDRQDTTTQIPSGSQFGGSVDANGRRVAGRFLSPDGRTKFESRALVIEVWCRDSRVGEGGELVYKDGVRVVTMTNKGRLILDDGANPNVNWERHAESPDQVENTYLFGRYPFQTAVSYRDKTTNWGFSALEQTADINLVLDEVISRLYAYIVKSLLPVLIVPQDTGIETTEINNKPGLILRPINSAQAAAIRYMDPPRVSTDIYQFITLLRGFFDQVWHIEDADRGEAPSGVIAAQAIQALQERNAVLMRAKIRAVDSLVETRGKAAISFLQNFGFNEEFLIVNDEIQTLIGQQLAGREFMFSVETGSTVHRTTLQTQQQAVELYKLNAIDRQALLEALNFPGWQSIIERVGESQLDQALQILIDAGMTEEEAAMLKQILSQPQTEENTSEPAAEGVPA